MYEKEYDYNGWLDGDEYEGLEEFNDSLNDIRERRETRDRHFQDESKYHFQKEIDTSEKEINGFLVSVTERYTECNFTISYNHAHCNGVTIMDKQRIFMCVEGLFLDKKEIDKLTEDACILRNRFFKCIQDHKLRSPYMAICHADEFKKERKEIEAEINALDKRRDGIKENILKELNDAFHRRITWNIRGPYLKSEYDACQHWMFASLESRDNKYKLANDVMEKAECHIKNAVELEYNKENNMAAMTIGDESQRLTVFAQSGEYITMEGDKLAVIYEIKKLDEVLKYFQKEPVWRGGKRIEEPQENSLMPDWKEKLNSTEIKK